jgi:lipoprotein-anchoring transpeptidase ErfK/SrfK
LISISRRNFLRQSLLSFGGLLLPDFIFNTGEKLGRLTAGMVELKQRPDLDSPTVGKIYEDAVLPWLREVVGQRPYRTNQRWVETPQGYVWAPFLQPVRNQPNVPVASFPVTSLGQGMWAEVTIPYVDLILENPPARSPYLQNTPQPRLYYSQVVWVDKIMTGLDGQIYYLVNERYGFGDLLWAAAEAFRPLTIEELQPIHADAEDKRIVVDASRQTIACYEGQHEVYFARVSTGMKYDINGNRVDIWETPVGIRPVWRKLISVHMTGGTTGGGWDIIGVSWTTLFEGNGVAIHSTFWHNNFGEPMSQGCVNCQPEDAKWIFRWSLPEVQYDPGDVTIGWPGGTLVEVTDVE